MIAEIDNSGDAHYYLPNHRGDTMLVLAENGDIEKQIRYDAFGNVKEQTGTFSPKYTFSTKEYLSDCQLYLYAYRVYDPIAGRWTQRDPIDYQDSVNLYQFCGNNPVNNNDPDGRFLATLIGGAVGAVGGGINAYLRGDSWKAGAIAGGLSGLAVGAAIDITVATGGSAALIIGVGATAGAIANAAASAGEDMANGRQVNVKNALISGAIGVASGAVGGAGAALTRTAMRSTATACANSRQLVNTAASAIRSNGTRGSASAASAMISRTSSNIAKHSAAASVRAGTIESISSGINSASQKITEKKLIK